MNVTEFISKIDRNNLFIFGAIVIFSLFFTTTAFPINIRHIAGLIFGIGIVLLLEDRNRSDISNFNREFEVKLSKIEPAPKFFHTDANIIDLFDNISDFKEYNTEAWKQMVIATDSVLQLHSDMKKGVSHCAEIIDTAVIFKNNAVNHLHSFIMSLPSIKVLNEKLKNNLNRFELLLRRHIDDMHRICREKYKKQGWSVDRKPLQNYGPRANDMNTKDFSRFDYYV